MSAIINIFGAGLVGFILILAAFTAYKNKQREKEQREQKEAENKD